MIFNWEYADVPAVHHGNTLKMGEKSVGTVYQLPNNKWRAHCFLPDAGQYGGPWVKDFDFPGRAKATLEEVCSEWVTKAALWRTAFDTDTMT